MTDKLRAALRDERVKRIVPAVRNWMQDKRDNRDMEEVIYAALAAAPQPATEDDYHNDPSADDRWNAGCDYAMTALCKLLRINTDDVTWDAATEELEGDVMAVLGNILTVRFGDDWRRSSPQPAVADREACRAKQAEPDRGSDETPYDRGYVWGYRHGLRDGKAEVAPQPAPVDREALVAAVRNARVSWANDGNGESCPDEAIADWLIEHGLLLPVDPQAAEPLIEDIVSRVSEWDDRTSPEDWPEALLITADELREELRELARGLRLPGGDETMAWAVVGEDGKIDPRKLWINSRDAEEYCERGERAVRAAIRVVEGGDDE